MNCTICWCNYHVPAVQYVISSKFILDKVGKSLVQPQVVPPSHCYQVPEPLEKKNDLVTYFLDQKFVLYFLTHVFQWALDHKSVE